MGAVPPYLLYLTDGSVYATLVELRPLLVAQFYGD